MSTQSTATSPILSSCHQRLDHDQLLDHDQHHDLQDQDDDHQIQPSSFLPSPLPSSSSANFFQHPSSSSRMFFGGQQPTTPNHNQITDTRTPLSPLNLDCSHNDLQQSINHLPHNGSFHGKHHGSQHGGEHGRQHGRHHDRDQQSNASIFPLLLTTVTSPRSRHSSSHRCLSI